MLTPMTVWLSVAVCMIALAVCRIFRTAAKGAKGFHKKFMRGYGFQAICL